MGDNAYLIWWTNESDCQRIVPLDIWPVYLYDEWRSRSGRYGRGRLWVSRSLRDDAPQSCEAAWDDDKWTCQAAKDAAGIVIKVEHLPCVQFLPGFVTTFSMELPNTSTARRAGAEEMRERAASAAWTALEAVLFKENGHDTVLEDHIADTIRALPLEG